MTKCDDENIYSKCFHGTQKRKVVLLLAWGILGFQMLLRDSGLRLTLRDVHRIRACDWRVEGTTVQKVTILHASEWCADVL